MTIWHILDYQNRKNKNMYNKNDFDQTSNDLLTSKDEKDRGHRTLISGYQKDTYDAKIMLLSFTLVLKSSYSFV